MKEQMLPATSQRTIECNFIEAAQQRVEGMRAWKLEELEPPTVLELETVLCHSVRRCDLLAQNWRNRVYRIELNNGDAVLAKQGLMATGAMLEYQYEELLELRELRIPSLHVPKPFGLMREKRILLMEFACGETIEALVWNREREQELRQACELAGKILGQIELAQTKNIAPIPIAALAHDLSLAPWSLSKPHQILLARVFDRLAGVEIRLGKVYYDYKAANLLFENGGLSLIDPPDVFRRGVLLWDFACFRSSMRRHLWRLSVRNPITAPRELVHQSQQAFERSYLASVGQPQLEPALFSMVVQLLELQRTGVLITMQQGKVDLAKRRTPIAQGKRLGGFLGNRLTLPLLDIEKRWLLRQLSRMPCCSTTVRGPD